MGGNGSYSKAYRGVPDAKRTHIDTNMRIGGHKVLLQKKDIWQSHNILNSHSANAIYVIGKVSKKGVIQVHSIDIFQGHEISVEINLKFDEKGDLLPYSPHSERGSHSHRWHLNAEGKYQRISHDSKNVFDIPSEYEVLIKQVVDFNKQKRLWEGSR